MNASHHGQCHIRRNSRDERTEETPVLPQQTAHAQSSDPQPPEAPLTLGAGLSHNELERMSQVFGQVPTPDIKVTGAEGQGRGGQYGSVSSSVQSGLECNHLDDSTTTSTTAGLFSPDVSCNKMRRRLKFFFMNPKEKWHARRRFPWKLLLQVFKVVVVTVQLCLFAQQRFSHVIYLWDTKLTFSHLFIKDWDSAREIQSYPPAFGPLSIYRKSAFYEYLDYAIIGYSKVKEEAVGTYAYAYENGTVVPPEICTQHYASGQAFLNNNSYVLDDRINTSCIHILPSDINATSWSLKNYLDAHNFTINFDLLLSTVLTFKMRTIKLRVNMPFDTPECYWLTTELSFNNFDHDGQMVVAMDVGAVVKECHGTVKQITDARVLQVWRTVINVTSIIICCTSLIMCVRAIYRAQILRKATVLFFVRHFNKQLSMEEHLEFLNLWYVLICINDLLIITGSFLKIGLESENNVGFMDTWNVCSLFLGLGNLFVWFGCLRYLGFFATYNVLILTLKKCIPNVLRFSICLLMVFFGYCLCGWLVLGPYHLKFGTFSSSMECLYSLINGDDMFATFSSTYGKDPLVWWFSRLYLYSFISLFIYVILSLFIAIIMDAYETIKNCYEQGFPESDLMKFVNECTEEPRSGVFHDDGDRTIHDVINSLCCCGHEWTRQDSSEYEPLIT